MSVSTVTEVRGFNRFYTRVLGLLRPQAGRLGVRPDRGPGAVRTGAQRPNGRDGVAARPRSGRRLSEPHPVPVHRRRTRRAGAVGDRRASPARAPDACGAGGLRRTRHAAGGRDRPLGGAARRGPAHRNSSRRWAGSGGCSTTNARPLDSFSAPPSPATSDGWSSGTVPATPPSTAGTSSFEALVARIVADFGERRDAKPEAAWIAELDGERVGCVFCTASETPDTAQLRLLLVEPQARGAGVGTRLVDECLRFARRSGYRANHVVDQRCSGRRPADLPAGRLPARSPRAAHEFRPRSGRRVLVARPVSQAAGAAPNTRWMSGFMACSCPPQ